MIASLAVRTLLGLGVLAALLWPRGAQAAEPAAEAVPDEDPDVVLSYDGWFLRLDAGLAYLRTNLRYTPTADDSQKRSMEPEGTAVTLQLAIAARLGRDVTLGGLGRLVHAPASHLDGEWHDIPQGLYYAELFIDHRLPAKVLRLGGGVGPGLIYTIDPERETFSQLGPVGSVWLGVDLPTSSRTALGIVADFTGAAMREHHALAGRQHRFDAFLLALGLAFTLRVSEPRLFPRSLPSLARGAGYLTGGGS